MWGQGRGSALFYSSGSMGVRILTLNAAQQLGRIFLRVPGESGMYPDKMHK